MYCYLVLSHYFGASGALAESDTQPIGFVAGFRPPEEPETLFVWQVGVSPDFRGRGLGRDMLLWLCRRPGHTLHFLKASVTPDNRASQALFRSAALSLSAPWEYAQDLFSEKDFGPVSHPAERLFRIGPIPGP